ncbi:MAG TPA: flagellar hook-associated protein FlgL [Phycisphaerae bacterium]|nr:flagellar hook-associated protein FlgL [Phycisphaerae bacterium]HOJ72747.1 flagellar hook-associated protein FlgL [Phycisphaerae bacterium]HOM51826.1 flagellar hook-associated protein FlgL [Phycisphaerae bacterium]HOQ84404.1 flagellar hook-associated protein FlgL [Phycisphaerae bacterium]HPP26888.1 flagellar hook-associated protein FlgL [Phycisphaerae bacterium]
MPVTSVNITRVSNNMQTLSLLETLRRNTLSLFLEQNRIATGNKFVAPSEDPVGSNRAIRLTEILEQQEQILANIRHADSFLAATDSGIGEINDLLGQAYSIASEMVNTTADQSQRKSMAELVRGIINQLVSVGNRTYRGIQLFGGQQTTQPPFTQTTGGVEYRGDTGEMRSRVDYQQTPVFNLNGAELFGMLSGEVAGNVDLNPAVTRDTRLADVAGAAGAGVQRGRIRITLDNPAITFNVDLTRADTVGDVIDAINQAAASAGLTTGPGGQFNATLNPAGNGIRLSVAAGTITVAETGQGVTARDLGLLANQAAGVVGQDLQPRLTTTTRIDSLFGGAGANLGSIRIQIGLNAETIDLSTAETIGDVLNMINGCGLSVRAEINAAGTGLNVINLVSGLSMSVGEAGGNTAELLGIRSMHGGTSLASLNEGRGVGIKDGQPEFRVVARDGSSFEVSLAGATTVQDVIARINAAATAAGVNVTASLAPVGNGLRLVDGTTGSDTFRVEAMNFSTAAEDLGILQRDDAGTGEILGGDVNPVRVDSVFSALFELYDALTVSNPSHVQEQQITRAAETIKRFMTRASELQGTVGARSRSMTTRLHMTEDAVTATRALLSEVKDLDYTEAITRFQQAQIALQGNLLTGPRLLQMTLLNFLD